MWPGKKKLPRATGLQKELYRIPDPDYIEAINIEGIGTMSAGKGQIDETRDLSTSPTIDYL